MWVGGANGSMRLSKSFDLGSNPSLPVFSITLVSHEELDKSFIVGEQQKRIEKYTCAGFGTDDGDVDVPWFSRDKPETLCIGVYKDFEVNAN